jgi:hypothetical protein
MELCPFCHILVVLQDLHGLQQKNGDGQIRPISNRESILISVPPFKVMA